MDDRAAQEEADILGIGDPPPNPAFNASHWSAVDALTDRFARGGALCVLTGERGYGRGAVAQRIIEALPRRFRPVVLPPDRMSAGSVAAALADALGEANPTRDPTERALSAIKDVASESGAIAVLAGASDPRAVEAVAELVDIARRAFDPAAGADEERDGAALRAPTMRVLAVGPPDLANIVATAAGEDGRDPAIQAELSAAAAAAAPLAPHAADDMRALMKQRGRDAAAGRAERACTVDDAAVAAVDAVTGGSPLLLGALLGHDAIVGEAARDRRISADAVAAADADLRISARAPTLAERARAHRADAAAPTAPAAPAEDGAQASEQAAPEPQAEAQDVLTFEDVEADATRDADLDPEIAAETVAKIAAEPQADAPTAEVDAELDPRETDRIGVKETVRSLQARLWRRRRLALGALATAAAVGAGVVFWPGGATRSDPAVAGSAGPVDVAAAADARVARAQLSEIEEFGEAAVGMAGELAEGVASDVSAAYEERRGGVVDAMEGAFGAAATGVAGVADASRGFAPAALVDLIDGVAAQALGARETLARGRLFERYAGMTQSEAEMAIADDAARYLAEADRHLAAERRTKPEGSNAYDALLRAHWLAPTHPEVAARLRALVAFYEVEAQRALDRAAYVQFYEINQLIQDIEARRLL